MRSSAPNMNSYGPQPRQSRLQNTQKSAAGGLGNGSGWGAAAGGFGTGFGTLGGAPGLGRGGGGVGLTGFAQVMGGGGTGQGPIDMSEFPSLSGGSQPANASAASWNSSTIRQQQQQQAQAQQAQQRQGQQTSAQQQQHRAPSTAPSQQSAPDQFDRQHMQADRSGGGEEFPPLGGQLNGDAFGQQAHGFGNGLRSPDGIQAQGAGPQTQLPFRDAGGLYQQQPQQQASIGQGVPATSLPQGTTPSQQSTASSQQAGTNGSSRRLAVKRWADMTEQERWGMPGLLAKFEARRQIESGGQPDETLPPILRSGVSTGHDLSMLGLDLDSPDPIMPTFAAFPSTSANGANSGAFDYTERHIIPDFQLPSAYHVSNVPPLHTRMNAFSNETLFQIFYQHPRDILQEYAAVELTSREWRWHRTLRQWLMKDTPTPNQHSSSSIPLIDLTNGAPAGTPSVRIGGGAGGALGQQGGERGIFIFFDPLNWRRERREFLLIYSELESRLMAPVAATGAGDGLPSMAGGASVSAGGGNAAAGIAMGNPGVGGSSA